MKLTKEWLKEKEACWDGYKWACENILGLEPKDVIDKLIEAGKLQWGNWYITKIMTHIQLIQYAVFAAEQVIDVFEKKHPNDKRPRAAIEAAKKYIENPNDDNNRVAADAAYAAYAADVAAYAAYAADAADAAADAADAAAYAAYAAAYAAYAADAADAAAYAARAARDAARAVDAAYAAARAARAVDAAYAAYDEILVKILRNGIEILQSHEKNL